MIEVPTCPSPLPPDIQAPIEQFATAWAQSLVRPHPTKDQLEVWDRLIDAWIEDTTLPLFVRRFNEALPRGSRLMHESGRYLVPTDNTPAHWAFSEACAASIHNLDQVRELLVADKVPIAMMLNASEKASAHHRGVGRKGLLNDKGWKLCHVESVKVGRGNVLKMPIGKLQEQFHRFMSPRNMFLIPLRLGGMGEVQEVIDAIRRFDHSR